MRQNEPDQWQTYGQVLTIKHILMYCRKHADAITDVKFPEKLASCMDLTTTIKYIFKKHTEVYIYITFFYAVY